MNCSTPRVFLGIFPIAVCLGIGANGFNASAHAQIVPDGTLGLESSLVEQVTIDGGGSDPHSAQVSQRIKGGAIRSNLLFHSFSEFNVSEGQGVYFDNPVEVESILGRITGASHSDIMGRLGVLGDANLFLLNPNGFVFGPNASLDVAGSFMATTADGFVFNDGLAFSAVNPEAPPLLTMNVTPGLQWGANPGAIATQSSLLVGQDVTLAGGTISNTGSLTANGVLTLESMTGNVILSGGQYQAGQHMAIASAHSLHLSDSVLTTDGELLLTANSDINIRDSHLSAEHDMVFRAPVRRFDPDSTFTTGGYFITQNGQGKPIDFLIPHDQVMISQGNVELTQNYIGQSLYILAGGSVTTTPNVTDIMINGGSTGVVTETIRDGAGKTQQVTVVASDRPTLDIRAGVDWTQFPRGFPENRYGSNQGVVTSDRPTGSAIRMGTSGSGGFEGVNLTNSGGRIFLTNQHQPNRRLGGGDIQLGGLDTSMTQRGVAWGGDIAIDARSNIHLGGNVLTLARSLAGNEALGGRITLLSGNTVTTQRLNASAEANALNTTPIMPERGRATVQGGTITVASRTNQATQSIIESVGNIETSAINSSASATAVATVNVSLDAAGPETVSDPSSLVRGGAINISTHVSTDDVTTQSDIGHIKTGQINSSASIDYSTLNPSFVLFARDSQHGPEGDAAISVNVNVQDIDVFGGAINLSTAVTTSDLTAAANVGHIQTNEINSSASFNSSSSLDSSNFLGTLPLLDLLTLFSLFDQLSDNAMNNNGGALIGVTGKDIVVRGGAIDIRSQVRTDDIRLESGTTGVDLGSLFIPRISSDASFNLEFASEGNLTNLLTQIGAGTIAVDVALSDGAIVGGDVDVEASVASGNSRSATADVATFTANQINSSTSFNLAFDNNAENRETISSIDVTANHIELRSGAIASRTHAIATDLSTEAAVGTVTIDQINSSAFARAGNSEEGETTTGGTAQNINIRGGAIDLSTNVTTADISVESELATLTSDRVNSSAAFDIVFSSDGDNRNRDATTGGTGTNVSLWGGAIALNTLATTGNIRAASTVGALTLNTLNAIASIEASNRGDTGTTSGGRAEEVTISGGAIDLETTVTTDEIFAESELGALSTDKIRSAGWFELEFTSGTSQNNETLAGVAVEDVQIQGGASSNRTNVTTGTILAESDVGTLNIYALNTSARIFANASGGEQDDSNVSIGGSVVGLDMEGGRVGSNTEIITEDIRAESRIGNLNISKIKSIANASANVSAQGNNATGGTADEVDTEGGRLNLRTLVTTGDIIAGSHIGSLTIGSLDTSSEVSAEVAARAEGRAIGGRGTATVAGGAIFLATNTEHQAMLGPSNMGTIYINSRVDSSTLVSVTIGASSPMNAADGKAQFEAGAGDIRFQASGQIQLGEASTLNASSIANYSFNDDVDDFATANDIAEVILDPGENAALRGGVIHLTASNDITLNQIQAEANAELKIEDRTEASDVLESFAGRLRVQTPRTIGLRNGADVSVRTTGPESSAGDVSFSARSLRLGNDSRLIAETDSGNGGDINLNLQNALLMQSGSRISTSAGTAGEGGNGGNLKITLSNGYILADSPNSNTDITANAFDGSGGRITILTPGLFQLLQNRPATIERLLRGVTAVDRDLTALVQGIFGLTIRSRADIEVLSPQKLDPRRLESNDITAISQSNPNLSGEIVFQTPDIDPSQGLIELPVMPVNIPPIDAVCTSAIRGGSEFTLIGRGGIPAAPTDSLGTPSPWEDWYIAEPSVTEPPFSNHDDADSTVTDRTVIDNVGMNRAIAPPDLAEAQGWRTTDDGTVQLVLASAAITPTSALSPSSNCHNLPALN